MKKTIKTALAALALGAVLSVANQASAATTIQPFGNGYLIHSPGAFSRIVSPFGRGGWIIN